MKTPMPTSRSHRTNPSSLTCIAAFVALVALIGIPLFSSSLASTTSEYSRPLPIPRLMSQKAAAVNLDGVFGHFLKAGKQPALLPFSATLAETIATFAADCTTPKTTFELGETVCAQTDNVTETDRFVNWCVACPTIDYGGQGITDINANQQPQNFLYTPTVAGLWKATIADPTDSSIIPTVFSVVTQATPLATYAADCATPKSNFVLGDQVCARAVGFAGPNNRFAWIDPENLVRTFTPISADPQTDLSSLPATATELVDIFLVKNRGTWKVNVLSGDGRRLDSVRFTVSGDPAADLSLSKSINGGAPDAGTDFSYTITLTNFGPNAASAVSLSDPTPVNATFVSVSQLSGPTFSCSTSDQVVCERPSLAAGETASFEVTYNAGAANSSVTNIANVTSTTTELNPFDNTASSGSVDIGGDGGTPPTCSLECPNDITVSTNTAGGANVTFAVAEVFGDCGTVTTSHASGSFFPTGTTTVTATSSTGGGSCTFTVTVIDAPAPTISCPANQTVTAPPGSVEATVSVGSPTVTGTGVTVVGLRGDEASVGDPYPVGTTLITWRATDQFDRSASCVQSITVTSPGAPTIVCPSDKSFEQNGCDPLALTLAQIGTPSTTGSNVATHGTRSDGLDIENDPYPIGTTVITWTATDDIDRVVSCTQRITVTASGDTENPVVTAPPSVSVTTNSCGQIVGESELGTPTATDNCVVVSIARNGAPAGNLFPIGTTTITYVATDGAGNTATATQAVTVTESPAIPPTVNAPADLTLNTGPGATACGVVVGDATLGSAMTSDNCPGMTVTRSGVPSGNLFPVGTTVVTYTATDRSGNTASDTQTVTVLDNTPPVVTLNGVNPIAVECHTSFADPGATANDACAGSIAVTATNNVNVDVPGSYMVTYTATDGTGNSATATRTVNVIDTTPPTVAFNNLTIFLNNWTIVFTINTVTVNGQTYPFNGVSSTHNGYTFSFNGQAITVTNGGQSVTYTLDGKTLVLWLPLHQYQVVTVNDLIESAGDACDSGVNRNNVVITQVTSDEGQNTPGNDDGNTVNDIVIAPDCKSVQLRAERANSGNGRVYTISMRVTDAAGNPQVVTSQIKVRRQPLQAAVDSGTQYTVTGSCP